MRTIIVAVAKNRVIGAKNQLPWYLPEDLKRFKEKTLHQTVIMGRKTFESLPENFRPLPQRENIVVSRQNLNLNNIKTAKNLNDAFNLANRNIFIIGGASIYQQTIDLVDCLEITEIELEVAGDAFFPEINLNIWELKNVEKNISENGIPFAFKTFLKKSTVNV